MRDVLVSYSREDHARIAVLVAALKGAGLDVWWDQEIRVGDQWRRRILTELESARCVVVAWSKTSTGPTGDFVVDEANRAKELGKLMQIRIDDVRLPLGFGEDQAIDLVGWKGDTADPRFQHIVAVTRARFASQPVPLPQDTGGSPPTRQQENHTGISGKRALVEAAVISFLLTVAISIGFRVVVGQVPSAGGTTFLVVLTFLPSMGIILATSRFRRPG